MSDVFSRYAPFIQDFIYDHDWESLRPIQVAAGDAIFNTKENVLLTASTASGKTEAAFFPILTDLYENPPSSIGCIYIGPLKALINDQFLRLNDLCREADIPVYHWHGDVPQSEKQKMLKHPSGILQITPESLESLLYHKHGDIPRLFSDLRYVVIDEVHSLLKGDRGGQTLCLLERLARMAGCHPRRIGLSATIGDPEKTGELLASGTNHGIIIPNLPHIPTKWRLSLEQFYNSGKQETEEKNHFFPDEAPSEEKTDTAPKNADPGIGYIFEHTRGKKCLVFCNSREEAEEVTSTLHEYCEINHEKDRFLIHHGNLSPAIRQSAEEEMRDDESSLTTVTTSTLELGIDIGKLQRAFQIDAPWTVSSFLQRMGRTGRRGDPQEMWFVIREEQPEPRSPFQAFLPFQEIQAISLVQLYLEERWCEPPRLDRLPYSLLYHQTMATLASEGEMKPSELARRVLSLSYFHRITQEDYKVLLNHLLETDQIQRTDEGGLIVGLSGERVTNSYHFYAVFQDNEEYSVRCDSEELGTIVKPPPVGDKIAIAGKVWVVKEIDVKRHSVYVDKVKGKVPAFFGLCPGDIHTKILERMEKVLQEDTVYPYLHKNAIQRLQSGRDMARKSGMLECPLVSLGENMWVLFPWLGTYSFMALERLIKQKVAPILNLKSIESSKPFYIQFTMKHTKEEFFQTLIDEEESLQDPLDLLYPDEVPVFDKYDEYVPKELIRKGFANGVLDMDGMKERVEEYKRFLF